MQMIGDQLYFSASDLNEYLECRHLTYLRRVSQTNGLKPPDRDEFAKLVSKKGSAHEERYLAALESETDVARIPNMNDAGVEDCVALTLKAMREGRQVIYQACFSHGQWRGQADFLFRIEAPSALGEYSYEVGDTKLALHTRPYHLLQLCFYSEMLARVHGVDPKSMRVILGAGDVIQLPVAEFSAYYRRVKAQFLVDIEAENITNPTPCAHCAVCRWKPHCESQRESERHLSLVANIRRSQIERLTKEGIPDFEALARAKASHRPKKMASSTFETLRDQARLQLFARETGQNDVTFLKPELGARRGFALLPPYDPADVFFDMEGDPLYWDRDPRRTTGLEYLFGFVTVDAGIPTFDYFFARNRAEEKIAFENFIDFVAARYEANRSMHVYHYAHYEKTALEKIAEFHATREDMIDELLKAGVFVDLYQVVRQGLRLSRPSYSIKEVEAYYRPEKRSGEIVGGSESVVAFEDWLLAGAIGEPTDVIAYNEDDCRSTYELCEWLRAQSLEAAGFGIDITYRPLEPQPEREETTALRRKVAELSAALKAGYPEDDSLASPEQETRRLLADLLAYHRREDRPAYWKFFYRRDRASMEELLDDTEAIAGLKPDPQTPSVPIDKSMAETLLFPAQETKLNEKSALWDPATDAPPGAVLELDARRRRLVLKRGAKVAARPLPTAVILGKPRSKAHLTLELIDVAEDVLACGSGSTKYPALWDVLTRAIPRRPDAGEGTPMLVGARDPGNIAALAATLDNSYLFVQGPPGTGKTYTGAQMIVTLLAANKRVGVAANAHKAIDNLLHEVERCAAERGVVFKGYKRCSDADEETQFNSSGPIEPVNDLPRPKPGELVACTVYSFPRAGYRQDLDFLFIDEAGQVALADALAIGTSARNLVFLGDPLQLAQVSQGSHPDGAGASVLEHLLANEPVIPSDRGVFLNESRRMHPDVCNFISRVVYAGELHSIDECSARSIEIDGVSLTGLRKAPVVHSGHSQRCEPEALQVVEIVRMLRRGQFRTGAKCRDMEEKDILVVAPYNAQVSELQAHLGDAGFGSVRVGTVDKFQGQEARAVIYSMATSSGADLPRDIDFLFSRNRLNVAISRAQCLAVLVYSPKLLEIACNSVDQMRLVNALCLYAEEAAPFSGSR